MYKLVITYKDGCELKFTGKYAEMVAMIEELGQLNTIEKITLSKAQRGEHYDN